MNTDLESILDADEEGRARIDAFVKQAAARIEQARREAEERRAQMRETARRALDADLEKILADADREAEQRGKRRAAYLAERQAHAQAVLSRAAEIYEKIILEGPPAETAR
jgi:hypothetical protein